jgi:hypothetical protein
MWFMKKIFIALLLISTLIFYSSGCADKIVTESNLNPVTPTGVQLSKFSEIQKNILTPTCALAGCHLGSNAQGNLDLSEGKSYSNIVNVQSLLFPSYKIIVPGNKEQSLLYLAVDYKFSQLQMPLTGSKLDQYLIDSLGVWIDKGAPND